METTHSGRSVRGVAAVIVLVASLALGVRAAPTVSAQAPPTCSGTPMLVTADCVDPLYNQPVIDSETDLTTSGAASPGVGPLRGHRPSGSTFYLPPKRPVGGPVLPVGVPAG